MNKTKLLKLVDFLKNLSPDKFDFSEVVTECDYNNCGTVCCAIGWLPAIFPDEVEWRRRVEWDPSETVLADKNGKHLRFGEVAENIFNIPKELANELFCPDSQQNVHSDLEDVSDYAAPLEVAKMLKHFIKLVEQGEINLEDHLHE